MRHACHLIGQANGVKLKRRRSADDTTVAGPVSAMLIRLAASGRLGTDATVTPSIARLLASLTLVSVTVKEERGATEPVARMVVAGNRSKSQDPFSQN